MAAPKAAESHTHQQLSQTPPWEASDTQRFGFTAGEAHSAMNTESPQPRTWSRFDPH